ncbi:MAG TPA: IS110 family transposase, partial [Draconibacterium sp.]|nr:IS110 family transposase [Draconibacterium sp.]
SKPEGGTISPPPARPVAAATGRAGGGEIVPPSGFEPVCSRIRHCLTFNPNSRMGHFKNDPAFARKGFLMNNCVGIDISKNSFDVHFLSDGSDHNFDYNPDNIKKTANMFLDRGPELIVMEATGGYEMDIASGLQAAGLPVAIVNPKRIRDFAKAIGQTAKTDKIDARVIARFGATLEPPPSEIVDETTRKIKALTVRKRQLKDIRTAEKNRTDHSRDEIIEKSIRTIISAIDAQISEIEEQIRVLISSSSELKQKAEVIQSFKGIGESTAAGLVSGLPEIGHLNRRQIASLTGTAPVNRDSGQFRGKRMTGGGRCEIRTLLYTQKRHYNRLKL